MEKSRTQGKSPATSQAFYRKSLYRRRGNTTVFRKPRALGFGCWDENNTMGAWMFRNWQGFVGWV